MKTMKIQLFAIMMILSLGISANAAQQCNPEEPTNDQCKPYDQAQNSTMFSGMNNDCPSGQCYKNYHSETDPVGQHVSPLGKGAPGKSSNVEGGTRQ